MAVTSPSYQTMLAGSHTTVFDIQVIDALGNVLAQLYPASGAAGSGVNDPVSGSASGASSLSSASGTPQVSVSRSQTQRRQLSLTVQDPTGALVPTYDTDLLAPTVTSGHYVRVNVWLSYQGFASQTFCLGTFAIASTSVTDQADQAGRAVAISGADRSVLLDRETLETAWPVTAGQAWGTAFQLLLTSAYASAVAEMPRSTPPALDLSGFSYLPYATPSGISLPVADAPWSDATKWAPAVGAELYWSAGNSGGPLSDKPRLVPIADPRTFSSVATYTQGAGATVLSYGRSVIATGKVPNVYYCDADGSGIAVPVRGTAINANPRDPRSAINGVVTTQQSSNLIGGGAQATAYAAGQMYMGLGSGEPISLLIIPDYSLGVNQVVTVNSPADGLYSALVIIDSIIYPLTVDGGQQSLMTLTGRRIYA